jgi:MFS family permease
MQDMFREEDRGRSMAIVSALTYAGPAIGPLIGGVVTQYLRWQWIFWILSIGILAVIVVGLFFLKESYTPVLLRRKQAADGSTKSTRTSLWKPWLYVKAAHQQADLTEIIFRPFQLYATRPVIYLTSGLLALDMGVYCLMLSSLAKLWIVKYHTSEFASSLHYIAVAIGATINGQLGSMLMDRIYAFLTRRNNGVGQPEFRIPYLVPGLILMPAGLIWYGWSAQHTLSWVMVDFGVGLFTVGSFTTAQAVYAYQLAEFGERSASAMAASSLLQNVIGFLLPIWAPKVYESLGYGWGNSLVALVMLVVGLPMAAVLWCWGERIRAMGRPVGRD